MRDLFLSRQPLSGKVYLKAGISLFLLKYLLDLAIVSSILGREWRPTDYLSLRLEWFRTDEELAPLGFILTPFAIPFIWIGVNLTLRRLRTIGWPLWLGCFFFPPYLNLLFFAVLTLWPKPDQGRIHNSDIRSDSVSKLFSNTAVFVLCTTFIAGLLVVLSVTVLRAYGWGLFVGIPFFTGFIPGLLYRPRPAPSFAQCFRLMLAVQALLAAGILFAAIDGAICILMAAPIALILGMIGVRIGLSARSLPRLGSARAEVACGACVALPIFILGEAVLHPKPSLFAVQSSIMVAAPPERVWQNVITFAELSPPSELIFRAGLAYPIRAEIRGQGVGAIRHCVFSTGPFIEPIVVWDAPKLLRFTVSSSPPPMRELSPFKVHPPHLNGYLESEMGQFELKPMPDGKTQLVGTTWYRHGLWPEAYWRIWSDYIIHTIHLRVLKHIQAASEGV